MVLIWALYYTLSLLSHIVHVMKGKSITCGKVLSEILKEKKNVKASSSE